MHRPTLCPLRVCLLTPCAAQIINTEEDAPAAPEKEPVKSSEGEKKETKEGWGDMIVSFFKGEQNVAAVKKRTDPSHKLPVMIQSVEVRTSIYSRQSHTAAQRALVRIG